MSLDSKRRKRPRDFNSLAFQIVKVHMTLKCTPAMEAGITKRLWEIEDLIALIN